ncbi:hypothetical protein VCR26J2_350199 [Vibrio coralliirubri]|nr:hypothetical protein VCR26J2_350199 [Vibrio coralliirubri]
MRLKFVKLKFRLSINVYMETLIKRVNQVCGKSAKNKAFKMGCGRFCIALLML